MDGQTLQIFSCKSNSLSTMPYKVRSHHNFRIIYNILCFLKAKVRLLTWLLASLRKRTTMGKMYVGMVSLKRVLFSWQ